MRKIIIAITLALGVAACEPQTIPNPFFSVQNPVTASNLYEANLAYDAALKAFNKMKSLCAQRIIPNTCRTYVLKGQQIIPKAEKARKTASAFIRDNPTINAGSLVQAFTILVTNLQAAAAQK